MGELFDNCVPVHIFGIYQCCSHKHSQVIVRFCLCCSNYELSLSLSLSLTPLKMLKYILKDDWKINAQNIISMHTWARCIYICWKKHTRVDGILVYRFLQNLIILIISYVAANHQSYIALHIRTMAWWAKRATVHCAWSRDQLIWRDSKPIPQLTLCIVDNNLFC